MRRIPPLLLALVTLFAASGCGHLDIAPEGNPNRVLTGTVNVRMNLLPPPDTQVLVRLMEPPDVTAAPVAPGGDLVIGQRGTREQPERIVAEQVVHAPAAMPVSFRIEYRADDAMLRRGLNIDARISWGGRIRFRTVEGQAVTLATANAAQSIWLQPAD